MRNTSSGWASRGSHPKGHWATPRIDQIDEESCGDVSDGSTCWSARQESDGASCIHLEMLETLRVEKEDE
jgi:hypothetical protein